MSDLPRDRILFGPIEVDYDIITPMIISHVRFKLKDDYDLCPEILLSPNSYESAEFVHVLNFFNDISPIEFHPPGSNPRKNISYIMCRENYTFGPLEIHVDGESISANFIGGERHLVLFPNDQVRSYFVEYISGYEDNYLSEGELKYDIPRAISLVKDIEQRYNDYDKAERASGDAEFADMERGLIVFIVVIILYVAIAVLSSI